MQARQIRVSVGELWVDRYCTMIALDRLLVAAHFLKCVSHVGVRVGKLWEDSDRCFVVINRLAVSTLLLQNGRQIRMGCRKVWLSAQCRLVQHHCTKNVVLLPFDVRQIIARVRMISLQL